MGLTSGSTLATAGVVAAAGLTALILLWRRWGGRLVVLRAVGILGCELLIVVTVGLAVNRWGQFYPTWSSLRDNPSGATEPVVGQPDPGLTAAASDGGQIGYLLRWPTTPTGMAGPPLIWLPPAYFRDATDALPAVMVVADAAAGPTDGAWPGNDIPDADRPPGACVIFARIAHLNATAQPPAGLSTLATTLIHDLHVAPHGWAVVGVGAASTTANHLASGDPAHFSPVIDVMTPGGSTDLVGGIAQVLSQEPPTLAPPLVLPTLAGTEGM
jgi:hypothetical protein